ncbi:protein farnesyltransferase subunit beta [Podospora conica]|nr:protein farnesyltransferase subunit beta [Schizothecium conicum]
MRQRIKAAKRRARAVFRPKTVKMTSNPTIPPTDAPPAQPETETEEVDEEYITESITYPRFMIPNLYTGPPPVADVLGTHTSQLQQETVDVCLPFLSAEDEKTTYNIHGVPSLLRKNHITFLRKTIRPMPAGFISADASRPWFLYWALAGLGILGDDVSDLRQAVASTARSMQNESGGFGGGAGQLSHLATTYAIVLSLAIVGGEEALEVIDRRAMWKWLNRLKQPDGGFQVCVGGEEDIRGAYTASVVITLLNLPLDLTPESPAYKADGSMNLLSDVADYVRRCQTYEGGISGQPDSEAHGAYAFCALACLALLDDPRRIIPKYLNLPRLISWLSARQYAPEGGFSGRTNKLVDGCYSHWVGGCFPLIEACLRPLDGASASTKLPVASESLFNREGLIRYILCCCQDQGRRGGLRDKPGKMSDSYHTCYVLSGLSSAQHQWDLAPPPAGDGADPVWTVLPYLDDGGVQVFEQQDLVRPIHPVYAIPPRVQEETRAYFLGKGGF